MYSCANIFTRHQRNLEPNAHWYLLCNITRPNIFGCRFKADASPHITLKNKHYTVKKLTVLYCICLHLPSGENPRRPAEIASISHILPKARGATAGRRDHVVVRCALSSPLFDSRLCWSPMAFL